MAAFLLGKELENNPREGVVNLANRAVKDDWQIHLHRHDGLVIDYDNIVGKMWQDLASEAPGRRAFGQLVANSIPINTSGDGR